ncbi:MAG: DJ-1/PfpI family protein [Clostridia bacterium]|nr:DJ-1/PfpI family protein [Clostridia bacterium]
MTVYILLAEGFEEIEALTPLDMLRRAGCEAALVSITEKREVKGAHGISVLADLACYEAKDTPQMVVLPGGMPGASHLDASPFVSSLVLNTLQNGGRAAAICAAPMVLGHLGLLEGKRAVCYPGFEKELKGATVEKLPVVTDGNITTSQSMGTALLFSFELVRLMTNRETAEKLLGDVDKLSLYSNAFSQICVSGNDEELFSRAVEIAFENGKISTSLLQRKLSVGFGKAAKMIDRMQEMGIVSAPDGQKPRDVLITYEDYRKMRS